MKRTLALTASTLTLLMLCACASPQVEVEQPTPTASASATPEYTGEFTIPEDFPDVIPVRSGEIVLGTATGDAGSRTWAVEVLIDDLEAVRVETLQEMNAAGFSLLNETGIGTETYRATLENEDFVLQLKIYLEEATGEKEILYLVNSK